MTPDNEHLLEPESREVAARLAARPWAEEVYLAGSAALALYVGHRSVRDLDLMTAANRLTGPERRDLLADFIELDPEVRVETARDGFLYVRLGSGVAVRLFYYPYPLIEPEEEFAGLAVASLPDIGLMKIAAIISRGTRRDFVDLYLLAQAVSLDELLDRSIDKFGHVRDFPLQALKGLADLSLAQGEPMPNLETDLSWDTVEAWLRNEVGRLGREVVGLEPQAP
jgi:hypothetical protein